MRLARLLQDAAAHAVHRGEVRIADLSRPSRPTVPGSALTTVSAPSPSAALPDAAPFLARLEVAERAISSGLGLTTAEVSWILGSRPTAPTLTRGGITATRTGWNSWRLQSADSPNAAEPAL